MEQKKILWIVVIVCAFLLIIFGAALFFIPPTRSTGQNLQQATAITPGSVTADGRVVTQGQSTIDPDSWVREPGKTPGLDKDLKPTQGNINLTIVNGDNATSTYGALDVSGLTKPAEQSAQTATTDGSAALSLSDIPGQTTNVTITNPSTSDTSAQAAKAVEPKRVERKETKAPAATAQKAKESAKKPAPQAAPKKATLTTEYWIQTGSFSSKLNAEKARETLMARYLNAEIFTKDSAGKTSYRVRVGPYNTKAEADYWLGTVKETKEFAGSYVSETKSSK